MRYITSNHISRTDDLKMTNKTFLHPCAGNRENGMIHQTLHTSRSVSISLLRDTFCALPNGCHLAPKDDETSINPTSTNSLEIPFLRTYFNFRKQLSVLLTIVCILLPNNDVLK